MTRPMGTRSRWIALAVVLSLPAIVSAAGIQAAERPQVRKLLAGLTARDGEVRERCMSELAVLIRTDEDVRSDPGVHVAVAELLRREAASILEEAAKLPKGQELDASHYHDTLIPAAMRLLDAPASPARGLLLSAMMNGIYNTGSRFAQAIAREGGPALDPALEMSRSPDAIRRGQAYDLLGMMLEGQRARTLKQPLDDGSAAEARRAVLSGLFDADTVCRREAVSAIAKARERDAIPILRVLVLTDPDDARGRPGVARYSVRGLAAQAIETIERER